MFLFIVISAHLATIIGTTADVRPADFHRLNLPTDEEYYAHCKDYWGDDLFYVAISVLTTFLDLMILILPCPAVWRLNMPKRQKIAVIIIILTGIMHVPSLAGTEEMLD